MNPSSGLYQCRLCLKRTSTKVNVLAGDFPKMLEILTSIKVRESDGLPKYSCSKCAQDVKSALITKRRIIKAHKLLVESLKKRKVVPTVKVSEQGIVNKVPGTIASDLIFSNSRTQKPIEFVSVEDPETELYEVIETVKANCEEVTLTKVKQEVICNDNSLHRVFDKVGASASKNFRCEICDIAFVSRVSYNSHCGKHKKTKCEICGISIRSDNFKKHLLLHTSGPTSCEICGATCKNIESLRGHIFYQHKSAANEYVCEECGKHFRIKYKFELHKKKEHTGIRNFKCETCGKAFFTKGNLTNHINMTHKKLRPHICEFCGTGFSSSYALKTHKRQHTNEKPFKCEFCTESFRQKVSLRSHLKSKHNVEELKEHFCGTCNKGFASTYALSIHARLHMTQKCEICSENFAEKEYLTNHLKEVHNIIAEEEAQEEVQDKAETENDIKSESIDIKPEN